MQTNKGHRSVAAVVGRRVCVSAVAAGLVTTVLAAPWTPAGSDLPVPAVLIREGVAAAPTTPTVREFPLTEAATRPQARPDRLAAAPGRRTTPPEVTETSPAPDDTSSAPAQTAPLTDGATGTRRGDALVVLSDPEPVTGYGVVGATWAGPRSGSLHFSVRSRTTGGSWSSWQAVEGGESHAEHAGEEHADEEHADEEPVIAADHGPNLDSPEFDGTRQGIDAVAVGEVDEVQLRVVSPSGRLPQDLRLAVVDPEATATAGQATSAQPEKAPSETTDAIALSSTTSTQGAARPAIFTRAQWGANESMRDGRPSYGTVEAGFVHHTVNANDYSRDQVPAIIRGIYAYHTRSRGWSDIGYNFLVDRFGRIWEGRYGGMERAVIGAHTLGYNHRAFAASAIGNFDVAGPPAAVAAAYARLLAWKLQLHGVAADSRPTIGGERFHAISGHRDAGSTACPGRYLYAQLPEIRAEATRLQTEGTPPPPAPEPTPTPTPTPPPPPPAIDTPDVARDIDGDGRADLVLRSRADGRLHLLTGESGPGFGGRSAVAGRWDRLTTAVGLGDLDRDGTTELLTRQRNGVVKVRSLLADGRLGKPWPRSVTDRFAAMDLMVAAGDLIRSGRGDLVTRERGTRRMWVHAGRSDGRFRKPVRLRMRMDARDVRSMAAAGDLTGDGVDDLLVGTRSGDLLLYPGDGAGVRRPVTLDADWGRRELVSAALDLTGDGRADLLSRNRRGRVHLQQIRADGTLDRVLTRWTTWSDLDALTPLAGGTGPARVLGRTSSGDGFVHAALDQSFFAPPADTGRAVPDADFVGSAGDWDGDGVADIVVRSGTGRIVTRPYVPEDQLGSSVVAARGWADRSDLAVSADVDGDAKPDVVAREADGSLHVHPGDGQGGLGEPVLARERIFRITAMTAVGKWNDDQWRDLVVRRRSSGKVLLVPGLAGGRFGRPVPLEGDFAPYDRFLGVGDLDGDGQQDLLATTPSGELWLLPGRDGGIGRATYLGSGLAGFDLIG